jgi:tetratricopeptide (TPR) repeat protein
MRRLAPAVAAVVAVGMVASCGRPVVLNQAPGASPQARMAAAAQLVRAGCLDCLVDAYHAYEALAGDPGIVPSAAEDATAAALRAAALVAIRERELGIADSGALAQARLLAASPFLLSKASTATFEIIETLGARGGAGNGPVASDRQLNAIATANRNRTAWTELLRARADDNELTAYLSLAFNCTYNTPRTNDAADGLLDALPTWKDTPLVRFRLATCVGFRMPALEALLDENPRFLEVSYYRGLQAVIAGDLDEADAQLGRAHTWRPRWAPVAVSRGNVLMTAEDFERAADFYDRAVALVPDHPEALLGKIRALTFAGRYQEALIAVDALLALERWYVGDARYWRAVNEVQLERHDEAWDDIERAAKLVTNADVPKLAGVIAVRRQQLPVARAKFEEALQRNDADCETSFYLATVLAEQREWPASVDAFVRTADCLDRAQEDLQAEIARLRAPGVSPERQARQIARREQQLAANVRMRATSWFNTAAGSFNLSRHDEARMYAERVRDDPRFGDRARDLLSRLPPGTP